jgi:hypothetical protein
MKPQSTSLTFPSNLLIAVGLLSLLSMVTVQAFGTSSFANASSRDDFPGRRQGGGTHWVMPAPSSFE